MWYPIAEDLLYKHLPVIVNAWYPGEQGGTAVAEVLFGDYNPAGRLPLTFKYSNLEVTDAGKTVNVSFTLKNTGKRAGDEVAQVYVKLPEVAGGMQAIKQLKGFRRIALKAGESRDYG